jgi:hypothetical protein
MKDPSANFYILGFSQIFKRGQKKNKYVHNMNWYCEIKTAQITPIFPPEWKAQVEHGAVENDWFDDAKMKEFKTKEFLRRLRGVIAARRVSLQEWNTMVNKLYFDPNHVPQDEDQRWRNIIDDIMRQSLNRPAQYKKEKKKKRNRNQKGYTPPQTPMLPKAIV